VLDAFEREGWPDAISDPLEPDELMDHKTRLQETAKSLNDRLMDGTIRFHCNGRGDGILWERVEEKAQHPGCTPGRAAEARDTISASKRYTA
jgi:hypothetical protein